MEVKQFIEKAIEGGWLPRGNVLVRKPIIQDEVIVERILLDPLAWQAVGKVEGWPSFNRYEQGWQFKMHRMIDALAEGKTIEEFLETL